MALNLGLTDDSPHFDLCYAFLTGTLQTNPILFFIVSYYQEAYNFYWIH
jgi:hypothetical protein